MSNPVIWQCSHLCQAAGGGRRAAGGGRRAATANAVAFTGAGWQIIHGGGQAPGVVRGRRRRGGWPDSRPVQHDLARPRGRRPRRSEASTPTCGRSPTSSNRRRWPSLDWTETVCCARRQPRNADGGGLFLSQGPTPHRPAGLPRRIKQQLSLSNISHTHHAGEDARELAEAFEAATLHTGPDVHEPRSGAGLRAGARRVSADQAAPGGDVAGRAGSAPASGPRPRRRRSPPTSRSGRASRTRTR